MEYRDVDSRVKVIEWMDHKYDLSIVSRKYWRIGITGVL